MKKLFFFALFAAAKLSAYIECQRLTDLYPYINEETLVVFNINNVLTVSCQDAGSTPWAEEQIAQIMAEKKTTKTHATNLFIPLWHDILIASDVELFDPDAESFVRDLQNKNIKVMALTNRYTEMGYPTHRNLRSVGIDFAKNPPHPEDFFISGTQSPAKYIEGIIFNGLINFKGDSLVAFLKEINYHPKKVIYIEDKPKHLAQVEKSLSEVGIDCLGVHFGALDLQRQSYRKELADLQVKYHFDILDDASAQKLVSRNKSAQNLETSCRFAIHIPIYEEISSLKELQDKISEESVLFTELDHVVWDTRGTIGSRAFLDYLENKNIDLGYAPEAAKLKADKVIEKVHRRAQVHLIEENSSDFFNCYTTYAFTFRSERLKVRTQEQADYLGLQFEKIVQNSDLETTLSELNKPIAVISSRVEDLQVLERLARNHGLPFKGYLFQSPNARTDNLIPEVLDLQLELLDRLLTNDEAEYLWTMDLMD